MTNAPYAIGLVISSLLWWFWRDSPRARHLGMAKTGFLGFGLLLGFSLTYGFWGMRLWEYTGNPVFPQFNHLFRSGFAPAVHFVDESFKVEGLTGMLLFPWLQTSVLDGPNYRGLFDLRIALTLSAVLVVSAALLFRRRPGPKKAHTDETIRISAAVIVFFVVSYAAWLIVFTINRYACVLEILAPVALIAVLRLAWPQPRSALVAIVVFLGIVPASMAVAPELFIRAADRLDWNQRFGEVTSPPDMDFGSNVTIVVFGGDTPSAFVAPELPPNVRMVRLTGNLYRPDPDYQKFATGDLSFARKVFDTELLRRACDLIGDARLDLYGLTGDASPAELDRLTLRWFGIRVAGACIPAATGYAASQLYWCPLERMGGGCLGLADR